MDAEEKMTKRESPKTDELLASLSREQLIELVRVYALDFLAVDGYWFQSVERRCGMDEAMRHDCEVWRDYTRTEARRLKKFLGLPERAGLDGLEKALALRFAAFVHPGLACRREENRLVFEVVRCRVQEARGRKGLPFHPCKAVGVEEYTHFAREIDPRIECRMLSCYPEVSDPLCACAWEFTLREE